MIQRALDPDRITDRLQLQAIERGRPLSCTLELTCRCNFQCPMCYIRMRDGESAPYGRHRTVEEWLDMARQLLEAGVLYLTLTGGECTQYPGFDRLYGELSRMGFRISVMSNAGRWTEQLRTLLKSYPPANVGVTLYGGSPETYGAVTGDAGAFEEAVKNIHFLKSLGVRVQLNFTMIRQNAADYPKVHALCRELNVPYTILTDLTHHHYDPSLSEALRCRLSPAERACVACFPPDRVEEALAMAPALEKELEGFRLPAPPVEPLPPRLQACHGSYTGCAIFWNGDMQTCISMRGYHPLKPFETGFEAAWKQLRAEHGETFLLPPACASCGLAAECLHTCAARRWEGARDPHGLDPYTCQYTYLLHTLRQRLEASGEPETPSCP